MSESMRSMILGPSALYLFAAIALFLTVSRRAPKLDSAAGSRFIYLFLLAVLLQCLHFAEEFATGIHTRLPQFLGLVAWSSEFYVTLNLVWITLWLVSVIGVRYGFRPAYFPVWFFAVGMIGNLFAHPVLALLHNGYFPGLVTSPIVGIMGFLVATRLFQLTKGRDD